MKKIFTTIIFVFALISTITGQDYKIENNEVIVEKVIQTDSLTIEQVHDAIETYFARAYNDSNRTQKLNTQTHLVYKGIYPTLITFLMGYWYIDAEHNIDILIKEGRCKIIISCSTADVKGTQSLIEKHYNFTEFVPVTDKSNVFETSVSKKDMIRAFTELILRMNNTINEIEHSLKNVSNEEDW